MKLNQILTGLALFIGSFGMAQNQTDVLLSIEDEQITVGEFMSIYNKNNVDIESADKKVLKIICNCI